MSWTYNPFTDDFDFFNKTFGLDPLSFTGADCSGTDGDNDRVLTATGANALDRVILFLGNKPLHPTNDYTVSSNEITFLVEVYDLENITVWGYT